MSVSGYVHLENVGDQYFSNSQFAGTRGQSRRLEGFSLNVQGIPGLDIEYMAHVQDRGDTHWHRNGDFCGSRGQSKRVEGVAIRLSGPTAYAYDLTYTVHVESMGDVTGRNGDFVGTRGQKRRVEGLQVMIQPRAQPMYVSVPVVTPIVNPPTYMPTYTPTPPIYTPTYTPTPVVNPPMYTAPPTSSTVYVSGSPSVAPPVSVSGCVHLQDIGDQYFSNSQFAGTRGQSRRLEGFSLNIQGPPGLDLEYMAHIQDQGDSHWHRGGQFCGSRGCSRRVEGIAIRLVGPQANAYEVLYTCHIEGMGDVSGRNGDFVGTRGQKRRLEGIQVQIQPKYGVSGGFYQTTTTTQVAYPTPGVYPPPGAYPGSYGQVKYT